MPLEDLLASLPEDSVQESKYVLTSMCVCEGSACNLFCSFKYRVIFMHKCEGCSFSAGGISTPLYSVCMVYNRGVFRGGRGVKGGTRPPHTYLAPPWD